MLLRGLTQSLSDERTGLAERKAAAATRDNELATGTEEAEVEERAQRR